MKIHPIRSVDCQLLFEDTAPLARETIEAVFEKTIEQCGFGHLACRSVNTGAETDVQITLGGYQVTVTQCSPLLEKKHLKQASRYFTAQNAFPDTDETIARCGTVTTIAVQKAVPEGAELPGSFARSRGPAHHAFRDSKTTLQAMNLVKVLAVLILQKTECHGVFWGPNGYLLPARRFCELAASEEPTFLYVRPHLYSPTQNDSENGTYGAVAAGAQYLTGCLVEFEPGKIPPAYMVENLLYFVMVCLQRGEILADGDIFGKDVHERIRVFLDKSGDEVPDRVVLSIEASAELGIKGKDRPTIHHRHGEYGQGRSSDKTDDNRSEPEPGDPVEAAIPDQPQGVRDAALPLEVSRSGKVW